MQWVPVFFPGGEVAGACALCSHGTLWGKFCYRAGSGSMLVRELLCSSLQDRTVSHPYNVKFGIFCMVFFIFRRLNFENSRPHPEKC
jgi:hypothetical protein